MRAIVMHRPGGPDVLGLEEVPTPSPGPGEVLLRVEAVGVSYHETPMRAGVYDMPVPLPTVFGFEAAGEVTQAGEGVDPAWVGRRVVSMNLDTAGSYAEYTAVPVTAATPVPAELSMVDAVAVALQGSVALCLVRAADLAPGGAALVEVASGSIGGYLVTLLRARGAGRIVATAGGPDRRDRALELGADAVLDHTDPDWPDQVRDALDGATLDAAFESIGGDAPRRYLDAMTPGSGRIIFYGLLSHQPPAITPLDLLPRGLTLTGCGGLTAWADKVRAARAEALDLAATGALRPAVDSVLPLADAPEAHRRIESRRTTGKIVLTP
ncbi:MAG: zinc-binding alcohol dehydrogenase family protein [Mycobacteriales bacterium]